jgi:hypothetical protein
MAAAPRRCRRRLPSSWPTGWTICGWRDDQLASCVGISRLARRSANARRMSFTAW